MRVGLIGLGKMGLNLALNLRDHNHEVIGFDQSQDAMHAAHSENIRVVQSVDEMLEQLPEPKVVWLMVPAGDIINETIEMLARKPFGKDGIVIDGGNTNYEASIKHGELLNENGIRFLDIGTSGGMKGARYGACLMIGGDASAYQYLESVFEDVSCEKGLLYTGATGSGHYLKMVHNGIEYGMMQAIGEGFEVLDACEFDYDTQKVASVWNHGSVIESWLMELAYDAFSEDPNLELISGKVDASGEGEWTVESALKYKVPTPVIALSLMMRYRSKQDDSYSGKVVAALRNRFGGHSVHAK